MYFYITIYFDFSTKLSFALLIVLKYKHSLALVVTKKLNKLNTFNSDQILFIKKEHIVKTNILNAIDFSK